MKKIILITTILLSSILLTSCSTNSKTTPMDCIEEFTSGYRNDWEWYSQVVKTCNETFWEKVITNKK